LIRRLQNIGTADPGKIREVVQREFDNVYRHLDQAATIADQAASQYTTADIPDSPGRRYVTDTQLASINSIMPPDLQGYVPNTRTVNGHALNADVTVTKGDVGLGNVPNTDATNPANITQSATYRFVSDTEKSTWNGKQDALISGTNIKTVNSTTLLGSGDLAVQAVLVSGTNIKSLNSNSLLGAGDLVINATFVGLGNVPNVNATVASNITQDSTHRFVTDTEKNTWNGKQDALVSGTNIKTINSTTLLGSGDLAVQSVLVSGTSIKTINSASLLGSGDIALQTVLVSGTSIKTVNSVSLLGSGDLTVQAVLVSGTNIKTINGSSILGSGDLTISGGSSSRVLTADKVIANFDFAYYSDYLDVDTYEITVTDDGVLEIG
jgi:hypothetical protein